MQERCGGEARQGPPSVRTPLSMVVSLHPQSVLNLSSVWIAGAEFSMRLLMDQFNWTLSS